jgi:hypothetical protein
MSQAFVPGYDRTVPPGQNHSPVQGPRISAYGVGIPWLSPVATFGAKSCLQIRPKPGKALVNPSNGSVANLIRVE